MEKRITQLLTLFFLLSSSVLPAQPLAFTYGTPGITERGMGVVADEDGNFLLCSTRFSFVDPTGVLPSNSDLEVVKTAPDGTQLWSVLIDSTLRDGAVAAIAEPGGAFTVLAQNCTEVLTGIGCAKQNTRIFRLDAQGQLLWQKEYYAGYVGFATGFVKAPDGGYVLTGLTNKYNPNGEFFLLKIDAAGEEVWETLVPVTSGRSFDVALADGGYYFAGSSIEANGRTALVTKVDEQGNILWTKYYGPASFFGKLLQPLGDGFGLLLTEAPATFLPNDLYRMDADGEIVWEIDMAGDITRPTNAVVTTDGIVVTGLDELQSENDKVAKAVKYDLDGNLVWAKAQDPFPGSYEHPNDIIEREGGFAVFGFTELADTVAFVYPDDLMLILLDENGEQDSVEVVNTMPEPNRQPAVAVFPNPFSETATFRVEGSDGRHELLIFDAFGRIGGRHIFDGESFLLKRNALPAGVYFFEMRNTKNGMSSQGKLVIR